MDQQCLAILRNNVMYTLRPAFPNAGKFKWHGYIDGEPWRFFRTKKDFKAAILMEPSPPPMGPHTSAVFRAEFWSTHEGNEILRKLREKNTSNPS